MRWYAIGLIDRPTLNDEFDMVRDGADGVAESARVETAVGSSETEQLNTATHYGHVITGYQLPSVLEPRESRCRRRCRLAEHVDRVALFLDQ